MNPPNEPLTGCELQHIDEQLLREWPLPMPAADGDKELRGRVLVIGGSREMPGAVMLAANAALRAGAGKLAIATGESVAQLVALAIPEARVIGLPETEDGGLQPHATAMLASNASRADAILIGPGMQDEPATCRFVQALLPSVDKAAIILDACAMAAITANDLNRNPSDEARILLTPHAGEMAHLTGEDKANIAGDPCSTARQAAQRWGAIVALKGATTFIASPSGRTFCHNGGNVGLAVSGSGDTLAGIIAGLAARGAPLAQAAVWGVTLHARAGDALAERLGPLGYLARELADQVPALMHRLGKP